MFKHCLVTAATVMCAGFAPIALSQPPAVADLPLSRWINRVLLDNPELQAAQAAVDAAGGRVRAASRPLFNPEVEFEYENTDIETATGGLSQTIDWSDKRGARAAVADFGLEGTRAELRLKRQTLATELLQALAVWHTAVGVRSVTAKSTDLMRDIVGLAEQRRKAGDLDQVELDLAHLVAAESALAQANASENEIRAGQAVSALAGTQDPDWPSLPPWFPDLDPQQLDVDRLLNDLPSNAVARARVAAARASTELSIREKRPDPTIGVALGKEDSETLTALRFSVPLFVRNTFSAEVEVANAELIQAEREAADHRRRARADLLAAVRIYQSAQRAWKTWQELGAPRLSQRIELLDRLWQAGELGTTDYLVQVRQALDTEISAIEQRGRVWQAWAAWLSASGTAEQWLNLTGEGK